MEDMFDTIAHPPTRSTLDVVPFGADETLRRLYPEIAEGVAQLIADVELMPAELRGTYGDVVATALITRVYVPSQNRRRGAGRYLLRLCTERADECGVVLLVHAQAYGRAEDMRSQDLVEWYRRAGFSSVGGDQGEFLARLPRRRPAPSVELGSPVQGLIAGATGIGETAPGRYHDEPRA